MDNPETQPDLIDQSVLDDLRQLDDTGFFFDQVMDTFLTNSRAQIERLRVGFQTGDAAEIRHAAHRLKGAFGTVGAAGPMKTCSRIENNVTETTLPECSEMFERLEREFRQVETMIETERKDENLK